MPRSDRIFSMSFFFFTGIRLNYFRYLRVHRLGRVEPPSHTSATESSQSRAFSHAPYNRRAPYSFAGLSERRRFSHAKTRPPYLRHEHYVTADIAEMAEMPPGCHNSLSLVTKKIIKERKKSDVTLCNTPAACQSEVKDFIMKV